jgi:hypothetical protein
LRADDDLVLTEITFKAPAKGSPKFPIETIDHDFDHGNIVPRRFLSGVEAHPKAHLFPPAVSGVWSRRRSRAEGIG